MNRDVSATMTAVDVALTGGAATSGAHASIKPAQEVNGIDPKYRAKVQEAAEKFEAFFIAQMMRQMRESTREMAADDSVYKDRVNQDMLDIADTALADSLSGQRAFGIADAILRQLLPTTPPTLATTELKELVAPVASND